LNKLKLGSLFDGIGGFPLSAQRHGIEPVWASEIEPFPIKVTQHHFPNMKHLGDITKINGAEIEPVDIITFGSPCQGLSLAGKREGLQDERSGLFTEAVRIIREMRRATRGQCPRFAVWENVPGAYSSNGGQDFRAVLEEIAEAEIPMPTSGKWAEAGMVRTERIDIAWRTLDAQYWGVPQRRKRIFLVADFTGQCAGEILFIEQGLRGDTAESGEARKETATSSGDGTEATSRVISGGNSSTEYLTGWDSQEKRIFGINGVSPTLSGSDGGGGRTSAGYVFAPEASRVFYESGRGWIDECQKAGCLRAEGENRPSRPAHTIIEPSRINCTPEGITGAVSSKWAKGTGGPAGDECYNLVIEPQLYDMTHADEVMRPVQKGLSPTLNSRMGTGGNQVPVMMQPIPIHDKATRHKGGGPTRKNDGAANGFGVGKPGDVMPTLGTGDRHAVAYPDPAKQKGEIVDGNTNQTNTREVLRKLWEEIGTEAFAEWGFRVLTALQQEKVLQQGVYGGSVQKETEERKSSMDDGTLSCEKYSSAGELRELRKTQCKGCTPQGRELEEQRPGQPGEIMPRVSQLQTQAEEVLFNLRQTGEGVRILRQTLSEVQEVGRPNDGKEQPIQPRYAVRRLTPLSCERLQGFPDGWTDIPGASDTARYKSLGNSVARPCVDFVMSRIAEVLRTK
jgi:DNA (cytosine-5)-methyltransferase 1